MSCDCGCCVGVHVATPAREQNRPGLSRVDHRPGCFGTFAQTMQTRLSGTDYPELAGLKARAPADASMALCDAWAVAADVLSFYQDRIANEGYLRTSTERRSLIELGRLTGYTLRPGVSASVYLAYDLDPNAGRLTIPPGTRAQSVPGAGEKMQTFETAEALDARAQWSQIKVRLNEPAWRSADDANTDYGVLVKGLTLSGTSTQLKPNDALLIDYGDKTRVPYRVASVVVDNETQNTRVTLRGWNEAEKSAPPTKGTRLSSADLVGKLDTQLTLQPRSALHLARDTGTTLRRGGEIYSRLLTRQSPGLREMLIPALRSFAAAAPTNVQPIAVCALRSKNALFGNAAPNSVLVDPDGPRYEPLSLAIAWSDLPEIPDSDERKHHFLTAGKLHSIPLDGSGEAIKPGGDQGHPSYAVVDFGGLVVKDEVDSSMAPRVHEVIGNQSVAMSIGAVVSSKVSQLTTRDVWLVVSKGEHPSFEASLLRRTQIYAQSERLELAPDPLDAPVAGDESANEIELDAYYDGLVPGLWVIASGDRADIDDPTIKVPAAERAMIAAVRHDVARIALVGADGSMQAAQPLPGDTLHTFVKLAQKLAYTYRRKTFTLYGNVVRATHGETRNEPLGGGNATRTFQSFTLKSPPLTHVAAATPSGVASTLQVRVNNLLWKASDDLANAAADARVYATRRDDSEATAIRFGDGVHGARLPSGPDNLAAAYRSGLGNAGNVRVGQITLATDKPLGVRGVLNPIRAAGGADPDTLEQARVNAPLAVTALDRLVSIQDYADFTRAFAGIGKAAAIGLHDGFKSVVHVTVAGIEDEPIDDTSDLFVNLVAALRAYGDPHLPVRVQVRRALSLMLRASVAIDPDYRWEDVQPRVRQALLDRFGFAARELGQPVFKSEILAAIESVQGVEHVFGLVPQTLDRDALIAGLDPVEAVSAGGDGGANAVKTAPVATAEQGWLDVASASVAEDGGFVPAQVAYLPADVTDCLILELAS
ncbi:MAG: putative baseplate assembly protein [Dokdonella sp.]